MYFKRGETWSDGECSQCSCRNGRALCRTREHSCPSISCSKVNVRYITGPLTLIKIFKLKGSNVFVRGFCLPDEILKNTFRMNVHVFVIHLDMFCHNLVR